MVIARSAISVGFLLLACTSGTKRTEEASTEPLSSIPAITLARAIERPLPARIVDEATLENGEAKLSIVALDVASARGVPDRHTIVYRAVAPATDAVLIGLNDGFEEWRVLRSPRAPSRARWALHAKGGTLRLRERRVELVGADGAVKISSAPPYAIDALGVRREASVTLNDDVLTVDVDTTGLTYPIAVDPYWSNGPLMSIGRHDHRSFGLNDGRVLIAGGEWAPGDCTTSIELYAPATNSFSAASGGGSLGACGGFATKLLDGRVMGGGGYAGLGYSNASAIFNPATSTVASVATMLRRRGNAAAAPIDSNRVIVCGSSFATSAGGSNDFLCDVYTISSNTWAATTQMNNARDGLTLTRLNDGTILAVGGGPAVAERYNPTTTVWTNVASMKVARGMNTATLLASGNVLVVGGNNQPEVYNPFANTWTNTGPMAFARSSHTATLLSDGRVLVAGGGSVTAEVYSASTNAWTTAGNLAVARNSAAAGLAGNGRVLISGGASSLPSTELWGTLNGSACVASGECVSRNCVDGVCCSTGSCATGYRCNVAPKAGTCSRPNGTTCGAGTECASGFCVDGVCCSSACTGQCSACNVAGNLGSCLPISGTPRGTRPACSTVGAGTPCSASCNGINGAACTFAGTTTACGSNACTTGVETRVGSCDGAGACSSASKSCGAYVCGTTACLTSCTKKEDCISGHACKAGACVPLAGTGASCLRGEECSTGFCADGVCCGVAACPIDSSCGLPDHLGSCSKKQGSSCAADTDCGTGNCVDGVCCDSKCADQCEACDVEGRVGVCSPVSGAPHGTRTSCDAGSNACQAKTCAGTISTTECAGFVNAPGTTCAPAKCEGGSVVGASTCDGSGTCAAPMASSCVPYRCVDDGSGARCGKTCAADSDCADGHACRGSRCEARAATCSQDFLSSIAIDGTTTSCLPYRCDEKSGGCSSTCAVSADCAPGSTCDPGSSTCVPPAPAVEDGGGCSAGRVRGGGAWIVLLLGAAIAMRRRAMVAAVALSACSRPNEVREDAAAPLRATGLLRNARAIAMHAGAIDLPARSNDALRISARPDAFVDVRWELADKPTLVRGDVLIAEDVAPGVDAAWSLAGTGAEQFLVLRDATATPRATLRIDRGPAIDSVRIRDGRIEALDRNAVVVVGSAPAFAIDARGVRRDVRIDAIDASRFTLSLDTAGLAYPIVVDPLWTTVASPKRGRFGARSVLLPDGRIFASAGAYYENSHETYNPTTNTWTEYTSTGYYTSLPAGSGRAGLALLDTGRVLLADDNAEIFNPATNTFTVVGSPSTRRQFLVPIAGGKAIGFAGGSSDSTVERFDEATKTWTAAGTLLTPHREPFAASLPTGRILVVGGSSSTAELYNPATNSSTAAAPMTVARNPVIGVALPGGKVFIAGGDNTAEVYDPATNSWAPLGATKANHASGVATLMPGGRVFLAGGRYSSAAEVWDPTTSAFTLTAPMAISRHWPVLATLADGRVLAAGGAYANAGTALSLASDAEVYGVALGTTCAANFECMSGNCVDGVCCATSSCATGMRCDVAPKKGTCSRLTGLACSTASECASGFCVDGYCCGSACGNKCEACDVAGQLGNCVPVLGAPHGKRPACTGAGAGTDCGDRCDGSDRLACHLPTGSAACGVSGCVAGVETTAGTCDGSGKCSATSKACGAFACATTTCKTSCTSNADCAAGYSCKGATCAPAEGLGAPCTTSESCSTGFCTDGVCCGTSLCPVGSSCANKTTPGTCAKKDGTVCANDAECGSGSCVDGVCCESRCDGQCEACDVSGKFGRCSPVLGAPHGARAACEVGTDACTARACDGAKDTKTCAGYANATTKVCREPSCDGVKYTGESTCDGAGGCVAKETVDCTPYRCDLAGCRTSCSKTEHCLDGFACSEGTCKPIVATCSTDKLSSTAKDGSVIPCSPYRCTSTGECGTQCATSSDCAPGAACDNKTCVVPGAGGDDGGCAYGGSSSSLAWIALAALSVAAAARRVLNAADSE